MSSRSSVGASLSPVAVDYLEASLVKGDSVLEYTIRNGEREGLGNESN